jgi:serine/threonine protein phosphatase 1
MACLHSSRQVAFLERLAIHQSEGDYLFVQARIRPGVRFDNQAEDDLLGIRESFLASEQDFDVIAVQRHSTPPSLLIRPNRISIDTGAGNGGKLTCAVFEEGGIAFIQAA